MSRKKKKNRLRTDCGLKHFESVTLHKDRKGRLSGVYVLYNVWSNVRLKVDFCLELSIDEEIWEVKTTEVKCSGPYFCLKHGRNL